LPPVLRDLLVRLVLKDLEVNRVKQVPEGRLVHKGHLDLQGGRLVLQATTQVISSSTIQAVR